MKSRLDINRLGWEQGFHPGAVLLDDHQTQAAVVLDVPGPRDELEPQAVILQDRLGVHGLMGGMEQQDKMLVAQGQSAGGSGGLHENRLLFKPRPFRLEPENP